ncbi:chondroitin sulfate synthase 1-like [Dendronephthya gigantea]|uniref:chondroitin sulfate synthase 1-like n=1 Tax=Dendronephthya gigantea TaxID=151771 RepID=UPI00106A7E5D|nr:chondroitin sulfate synthase 1-like [Dendronephthya gigantea]
MFTLTKDLEVNNKDSWSLRYHKLQGTTGIIRTIMDAISKAHHENLQFHALYYGYMLNQPIRGLQYRLNIFTNKDRHIARSYQKFGAIEKRIIKTSETKPVTIVVPLAGRLNNFKQFMKNLEQNILKKNDPITLLVAYFPEVTPSLEHKKIFHQFNMTYRNHIFIWLDLPGSFARAQALQAAVDFNKDNNLLFFADVDLTFNEVFLQRCRDNTVAKQRVYFPVMFKLFNPKILGFQLKPTEYFRSFDREVGDWALYSFGPVCAYSYDVISIGGFNVKIKEWGYEDIHLFEAFISRNKYDIIRAADPGLIHIYHAHSKCDVIKNNIQRLMCTGAMLNSLASEDSIVKYLLMKKYVNL